MSLQVVTLVQVAAIVDNEFFRMRPWRRYMVRLAYEGEAEAQDDAVAILLLRRCEDGIERVPLYAASEEHAQFMIEAGEPAAEAISRYIDAHRHETRDLDLTAVIEEALRAQRPEEMLQ